MRNLKLQFIMIYWSIKKMVSTGEVFQPCILGGLGISNIFFSAFFVLFAVKKLWLWGWVTIIYLCVHFGLSMYDNKQLLSVVDSVVEEPLR